MYSFDTDDGARAYFRLTIKDDLYVFWIDVHPRRRDDCLLLPTFEIKIARFVHLAQVTRAQPAFIVRALVSSLLPVSVRNIWAAHQNLARLVEPHFLAGQDLAD